MAFNIQNIGHQIANDVKIQINREFLSKFPDKVLKREFTEAL